MQNGTHKASAPHGTALPDEVDIVYNIDTAEDGESQSQLEVGPHVHLCLSARHRLDAGAGKIGATSVVSQSLHTCLGTIARQHSVQGMACWTGAAAPTWGGGDL